MSAKALTFEVYENGALVVERTLAQRVIKIGSLASSHLRLDRPGVARMHAVIEATDDGISIVDLGGASGTVVNGRRITKAILGDGDRIAIGALELIVRVAERPALPATPVAPDAPRDGAASRSASAAAMPATTPLAGPAVVSARSLFVDLGTLEDPARQAVEVVALWNGSVLQVSHYRAEDERERQFLLGEEPRCDFPLPATTLGGATALPLVTCRGGQGELTIPPGASGDLTQRDGTRVRLAELIAGGIARPSLAHPGAHTLELPPGARLKVDLGAWSFLVNGVPNPRRFRAPVRLDWTAQVYAGFSLALHAVFLFLVYFIPPNPAGISLDQLEGSNRFLKVFIDAHEVTREDVPDWVAKKDQPEPEGGKGKRHKGEEGKMGSRDARKTDNHYAIKGPADTRNPHMARDMVKEMAATAGVLSYLTAANAPTSPFGQDTALGTDPENALGALLGNQPGENFGYGGLGIGGTGRGGGGTGEGTIGLGNLNTIGRGGGGGNGIGYGKREGGLGPRRPKAPIRVRSGGAMVKGSLSKDVIRRVVHRHINEVKYCYERELYQRPDLSGRVSIKFIISGTGAVQNAAVATSTVGNAAVEQCISQAVRRWTFPQPDGGGIVIVTYPFVLANEGN